MVGVAGLALLTFGRGKPAVVAGALRNAPGKLRVAIEAQLRRQSLLFLVTLRALVEALQRRVRLCQRTGGKELRARDPGHRQGHDHESHANAMAHDHSQRKPTRTLTHTCMPIKASSTMASTTCNDRHADISRLNGR